MNPPPIVFKYKSLQTEREIERVIDIFQSKSIYWPTCEQLNDPFEGTLGADEVSGWAGKWGFDQFDRRYPFEENLRKEYRVFSVSDTCFSPQMWAYYAGNYNGICIGFYTENNFARLSPVIYRNTRYRYCTHLLNSSEIDKVFYENLFVKHKDWSSENEWRLIQKSNQKYITFSDSEIACIIIGDNVEPETAQRIYDVTDGKIQIFRAIPGARTLQINLLPYGYEVKRNGCQCPYISEVEQLLYTLGKVTI